MWYTLIGHLLQVKVINKLKNFKNYEFQMITMYFELDEGLWNSFQHVLGLKLDHQWLSLKLMHYLLIRVMNYLSYQDEFSMVSALVCIVTH